MFCVQTGLRRKKMVSWYRWKNARAITHADVRKGDLLEWILPVFYFVHHRFDEVLRKPHLNGIYGAFSILLSRNFTTLMELPMYSTLDGSL